MMRGRHLPGCECSLPGCVAILKNRERCPDRAWVLNRFETMLVQRGVMTQVSGRMARVEADGAILIVTLTAVVQAMLSAAGHLPTLEWGSDGLGSRRVTGERTPRQRVRED